jgi:hypothetical protein
MNLALQSIFIHTSKGSLTCRKILRHGAEGFTSPPKEGVLGIVIALKSPSPSTAPEPANLGSNGKHANHYTTVNYTNELFVFMLFVYLFGITYNTALQQI